MISADAVRESGTARACLIPPRNSFWQWRHQGEVVTWADGRTIAFRSELAHVLTHLAPTGLPSLGAILLLIAATRDNWGEVPSEAGILAGCLKGSEEAWASIAVLYRVIEGLEKVHRLDADLRSAPQAKAILAEVVFEGAPGLLSARESAIVARHVSHRLDENITEPAEYRGSSDEGALLLLRELRTLDSGLKRVDPEVLRLRRRTGLDELPRAAPIEPTSAQRVRALLAELEQDAELRGLATLALRLMAAVSVPRPVTTREELQVGGISDITNRGPLDRLLLSELAHDDLTLAVRVAVNEALYLRRESPPRTPARRRAVLLDAGIRTWGVPRVFATAVALALAAAAERTMEVDAYRAKGDGVEPVDLTTRAGIVDHLEALEPDLHPGSALQAFQATTSAAEEIAEPIIVTTEDVLEDPEFRQSLADHVVSPLHMATVNRDGHFRLLERSSRGSKLLKEVQLDLAELFAEPTRVAPALIDRDWVCRPPAIFSIDPFPLLLSHNLDPKGAWQVEHHGVLALTKDRRLMFWRRKGLGALQIADNMPPGTLWWFSRRPLQGVVRAVVGFAEPGGLYLLQIDLNGYRCWTQRLEVDRGVRAICSHSGALFAVFPGHVLVLSPESGEVIQTLNMPAGMAWVRDRFFRAHPEGCWYALSYDGRTARLEPVMEDNNAIGCPKLLTLFERDGVDGPIGVTALGDLFSTATGDLRKINHLLSGDIDVAAVSPDGGRVWLRCSQNPSRSHHQAAMVDTATARINYYQFQLPVTVQSDFSGTVRQTSLRHRLTRIGVDQHGVLTLTSRKGRRLGIEYDPQAGRIVLRPKNASGDIRREFTFQSLPSPPDVGFRLSRASWDDGSEAILDSRGLLHLRSSDPAVPEISIVLTDGALAGWCSDGRLWGRSYFIGEYDSASMSSVFETAIKAFAERLR